MQWTKDLNKVVAARGVAVPWCTAQSSLLSVCQQNWLVIILSIYCYQSEIELWWVQTHWFSLLLISTRDLSNIAFLMFAERWAQSSNLVLEIYEIEEEKEVHSIVNCLSKLLLSMTSLDKQGKLHVKKKRKSTDNVTRGGLPPLHELVTAWGY